MWPVKKTLHDLEMYNKTFEELAERKTGRSGSHWVFRGLSNSHFSLSTTLERVHAVWKRDGLISPTESRRDLELRLLREFKRRCHHYPIRIPHDDDLLEWLAVMRHWGAPTRLMDWTYSYHIATFFALQYVDERSAEAIKAAPQYSTIWAIELNWLRSESHRFLQGKDLHDIAKIYEEASDQSSYQRFAELLNNKTITGVYNMTPYHLNERLSIQQGLFLLCGDLEVPFMDGLRNMPSSDEEKHVRVLEIGSDLRCDLLKKLVDMNITSTTLFPGLEGYAQSLNTLPPPQTPAVHPVPRTVDT